ncbi:MAG: hypothetical protein LBI96_05280, partial [Odoribacteraceae bacterium]|nr:hypothetical protein [Odoribacteraceae bacterium]
MKENYEEYILRQLRGECTEEDKEILSRWIGASEDNRREYEETRFIMQESHLLKGLGQMNKKRAWQRVRRRTKRNPLLARVVRYAASICLPFLIVVGYLILRPGAPAPTGAEEQSIEPGTTKATLFLSDGQRVDLLGRREAPVIDHHAAREIALDEGTNALNYHDTTRVHSAASAAIHKVVVPRGGEYPLTLPDGTKVW